jgi:predicted ATPase
VIDQPISGSTVHGIRLRNFKRFDSFYLSARSANILVGPNNSGKSTILDALRVCQACLRYTRVRSPAPIDHPTAGIVLGYHLPLTSLPIPIANVTTNYNDEDAIIEVRCANGNSLVVRLHPERPILFHAQAKEGSLRTSKLFRAAIPLDLIIVPPLGPFEETEYVVQEETIQRNESSRLANRYFRNIWVRKSRPEWNEFNGLVSSSWPGVEVKPAEWVSGERAFVQMFYREGRGERELYWSGYGFQVWLQMLTHVMRGNSQSVLVIDEPDIYLHPELQRKLLRIVRERFGQFFMATHSVEIINEAEPGAVISVHPDAKSAKRVLTDEEYQALFNYLGSFENIDFSRLSRARRIVFFEGKDKKLLRRFAQKVGALTFANDLDTIILHAGGFGQWRRVKDVAWTFREVLKLEVSIFALFDRDYRSDEEIDRFLGQMKEDNFQCFVLNRKEIENYALVRDNLIRVISARQKERLPESRWMSAKQISRLIDAVSTRLRSETHSQIIGHRIKYFQQIRSGIDSSTVTKEATIRFEKDWSDIDRRLSIIGGKEFIAELSTTLQKRKGFSVTVNMLIEGLLRDEVPKDLVTIMRTLDEFCRKD